MYSLYNISFNLLVILSLSFSVIYLFRSLILYLLEYSNSIIVIVKRK